MNSRHTLALRSCRGLVFPLIVYKISLMVVIVFSQFLLPVIFSDVLYQRNFHFPKDAQPTRSSMFKTWDGQHYLFLSEYGYRPDVMPTAFYPLWPFLIRIGSYFCGGSYLIAGLVLANLLSILGILALYYLVFMTLSPRAAESATLLLLAYPGAIFLSFVYTEALFLFLSVFLFVFLYHRKVIPAAVCAFLLPLARPTGILIFVPLAYWFYANLRENGKWDRMRIILLLAPLGGFLCYLGIMQAATGNAFEGFQAQKLFMAKSSPVKLVDIVGFGRTFLEIGSLHQTIGSALDRIWFLIFLGALVPVWKMNRTLFFYALVMGLVPAMTVSLMAYMRYLLVVFPVFMVFGEWLGKPSRIAWRYSILAGLFSVQVLFLIMHINNYWVG